MEPVNRAKSVLLTTAGFSLSVVFLVHIVFMVHIVFIFPCVKSLIGLTRTTILTYSKTT